MFRDIKVSLYTRRVLQIKYLTTTTNWSHIQQVHITMACIIKCNADLNCVQITNSVCRKLPQILPRFLKKIFSFLQIGQTAIFNLPDHFQVNQTSNILIMCLEKYQAQRLTWSYWVESSAPQFQSGYQEPWSQVVAQPHLQSASLHQGPAEGEEPAYTMTHSSNIHTWRSGHDTKIIFTKKFACFPQHCCHLPYYNIVSQPRPTKSKYTAFRKPPFLHTSANDLQMFPNLRTWEQVLVSTESQTEFPYSAQKLFSPCVRKK